MPKLNKNSPIPLSIQTKEHLLAQIESGELKPGQRLPSERELCKQFSVSRITIRPALQELMRDGLVQSVPGKGTFVIQKLEEEFHPLSGFSQDVQTQGHSSSSRILKQTVTHASLRLAKQLQIPNKSQVAFIERLRLVDGEPRLLQATYVPLELCPDILKHHFETESLYRILSELYRLAPVRADNSFEARLAQAEEEELLLLPHPAAVLVMRQTSYLKDNRPIEYTRSIYRANDRFHSIYGPFSSHEEDP